MEPNQWKNDKQEKFQNLKFPLRIVETELNSSWWQKVLLPFWEKNHRIKKKELENLYSLSFSTFEFYRILLFQRTKTKVEKSELLRLNQNREYELFGLRFSVLLESDFLNLFGVKSETPGIEMYLE